MPETPDTGDAAGNDTADNGGADKDTGNDKKDDKPKGQDSNDKSDDSKPKFTQAELNAFLAKERRETEERLKKEADKASLIEQSKYKELYENEKSNLDSELDGVNRLKAVLNSGFSLEDAEDIAGRLKGKNYDEYLADAKVLKDKFHVEKKDDEVETPKGPSGRGKAQTKTVDEFKKDLSAVGLKYSS